MTAAVTLFVFGLIALALGGDSIVKGSAGLSQRFGASPFVTGLVLVAFGTSLPELFVNLSAILSGQQSLALGNAVGSNVVNFGLTLGLAALVAPLVIRWRALSPMLLVLMAGTVALLLLGRDGVLSRGEGVAMLLAFVAVLAYAMSRSRHESVEVRNEIAGYATTSTDLVQNLIRFAMGAGLLWLGALLIVGGHGPTVLGVDLSDARAAHLGVALGLSPMLTGLLPVAIGTALPEIAAAMAAARRGQGDMVAGHVIGASLFNLLVVVGGMAAFNTLPVPLTTMSLPPLTGTFALPMAYELLAALALAAMLYPMLRGDLRISKAEGAVLVVAFMAWVVFELVLIGT